MSFRRSFFLFFVGSSHVSCFLPIPLAARLTSSSESTFFSSLWLASNSEDSANSSSSNETVVTKEMFLRDLLRDPSDDVTVKRRSKSKGKPYKVLDNRDRLPFAVTLSTPDPYTHPEAKKQAARKQSKNTPRKRHDAVEAVIASSLYIDPPSAGQKKRKKKGKKGDSRQQQVDTTTWLGDFVLDKYTTTGDLLEIGDLQYRVVRHKCQYKYAGGKRFVMVRKILQVKEVGRLQTEEYLRAQWEGSVESSASQSFPPEET